MIVWIDLETTGLLDDPEGKKHTILEVAMIITDDKLNEKQRYQAVIRTPSLIMDTLMNGYVMGMHRNSGLYAEALVAEKNFGEVEQDLVDLITNYCGADKPIIAGSTIGFDKSFLQVEMPRVARLLHYRSLDVSSFKEGLRRAMNYELPSNGDKPVHRAMPDIEASILEFKKYMAAFSVGLQTLTR